MEYIDISSVGRNGLQAKPEVMRFENAPSRARRLVGKGDTVVSTVRTYLRAVWAASGDLDRIVVSTGFAVLSETSTGFFSGECARCFHQEVVARSTEVSPCNRPPELGELLRVPPREEQQAIADLDTETARIDALTRRKADDRVAGGAGREVELTFAEGQGLHLPGTCASTTPLSERDGGVVVEPSSYFEDTARCSWNGYPSRFYQCGKPEVHERRKQCSSTDRRFMREILSYGVGTRSSCRGSSLSPPTSCASSSFGAQIGCRARSL